MEDFHVIKYKQKHLKNVRTLWEEYFEADNLQKRKVFFNWLAERNPFLEDSQPYFLLLHGEKVIGMHGHMPLIFSIYGQKKKGFMAHDDLLATDYRGKGLGKIMLKGVAKQATSFAGALWFNEANYRLYLKSGWLDVPNLYPFVKIFHPKVFLEKKFKNQILLGIISFLAKTALKIREISFRRKSFAQIDIIEIDRFDERFDDFFEAISPFLGIMVVRTQRYLNWKFVEKPFNNYKLYSALDNKGNLLGYMVIKTEIVENIVHGKILDILTNPHKPEAFEALIKKSIEEFSKLGANHINILVSYPPYLKVLAKFGFIKARNPQRFMIINWADHFEKDFVTDISNWYLTYSDADGDAWAI